MFNYFTRVADATGIEFDYPTPLPAFEPDVCQVAAGRPARPGEAGRSEARPIREGGRCLRRSGCGHCGMPGVRACWRRTSRSARASAAWWQPSPPRRAATGRARPSCPDARCQAAPVMRCPVSPASSARAPWTMSEGDLDALRRAGHRTGRPSRRGCRRPPERRFPPCRRLARRPARLTGSRIHLPGDTCLRAGADVGYLRRLRRCGRWTGPGT
jgi:hypothetical protein